MPTTGFKEDPNNPGTCIEICGDGKRVSGEIECDDGNNRDGDGCTFNCKIEVGFECSGGNLTNPDVCEDKRPIRYRIENEKYPESKSWYNYNSNAKYTVLITLNKPINSLANVALI